jgi:GT2 family glycosyltransferase
VDEQSKGYFQSYTPWNPYNGWHDQLMNPYINNYRVYEGYRTSYEVGGWCLVTRNNVLSKMNLSDRVNFWYSDNVYIDEIRKLGMRHALVRESKVSHICSVTTKNLDQDKIKQITEGQRKPYLEGINVN